jgi:organic radical activating enzyme
MYNLEELTSSLQAKGIRTNIETSGAYPLTGTWDWVCLSPKKFKAPVDSVLKQADELKTIVYNKSDFEWAEKYAALVRPDCELFLQPEWSKEKDMTPIIIEYVKQNPKWKISLQIHKYMNIP